jgi:hypothetical protein
VYGCNVTAQLSFSRVFMDGWFQTTKFFPTKSSTRMTATINTNTNVQQQIERNYRWNFLVNTLDGANFWFGMSFFSSTIILPLFVSHFTNNPLIIGHK